MHICCGSLSRLCGGQIYQLPDWRLVFLVKNFPVGQRVLVDSSSGQSAAQGEGKKEEVTRQGEIPLVKEVALVALGNNRSRPYLLVSFPLWLAPSLICGGLKVLAVSGPRGA